MAPTKTPTLTDAATDAALAADAASLVNPIPTPTPTEARFAAVIRPGVTTFQFVGSFGAAADATHIEGEYSSLARGRQTALLDQRIADFRAGGTFTRLQQHRARRDKMAGTVAEAAARRDAASLAYAKAVQDQSGDVLQATTEVSDATNAHQRASVSMADLNALVKDLEVAATVEWRSVISNARQQLFNDASIERQRRLTELATVVFSHIGALEGLQALQRVSDDSLFGQYGRDVPAS
jgi:hypothetical protein